MEPSWVYTSEEPSFTARAYEPDDRGLVRVPEAIIVTASPRFGEAGVIDTLKTRERGGEGLLI